MATAMPYGVTIKIEPDSGVRVRLVGNVFVGGPKRRAAIVIGNGMVTVEGMFLMPLDADEAPEVLALTQHARSWWRRLLRRASRWMLRLTTR